MPQEKEPAEKEPESNFTFRMPDSLRAAVSEIANTEKRSLSKVVILLLWRGIRAYQTDGILLDKPGGTGGLSKAAGQD